MRGVVRPLLQCLLVLFAAGCAHVEAPTGGPQTREPLVLESLAPDSLSLVPELRGPAVFAFGRRLSERGLDDAVMVSPRTSPVAVGHRGRELRVGLRGGWQPGQIYQITIFPQIQDLWNNRLAEPVTLVFSTGPEIPETLLRGEAIDRITGRPEVGIRVEAVRAADSLVYATQTDSAGAFVFSRIPEGDYQVRAFRDVNRNRELDAFEARDTTDARLVTADSAAVRLSVVLPDSTPPQVASARVAQQIVEVQFDDHLDPQQELTPAQVRIFDAGGTEVPVARLAVGQLQHEAGADTAGAAPARPAPPARAPQGAPGVAPGARPSAPQAAPQEPLPSQTLAVEPAAELVPGAEYRIRVEGVRNVVGLVGGGETTVTAPEAPATPTPPAAEQPGPGPVEPDDPEEPDPGAVEPGEPDVPDVPDPQEPGPPGAAAARAATRDRLTPPGSQT